MVESQAADSRKSRRDRRTEALSIRELAERHKVHRRAVRQALASALPPPRTEYVARSRPAIDPWAGVIDAWLIADQGEHRKQRHTARRVWQRLVAEHGAVLSEVTVSRLARLSTRAASSRAGTNASDGKSINVVRSIANAAPTVTGRPVITRESSRRSPAPMSSLSSASVAAFGTGTRCRRHTGNTLAAQTGTRLRDLMTRMGHDSPRAALIYQHASSGADRAIADALDLLIAATEKPADTSCSELDPGDGEERPER
jgi:hypothetical protein